MYVQICICVSNNIMWIDVAFNNGGHWFYLWLFFLDINKEEKKDNAVSDYSVLTAAW